MCCVVFTSRLVCRASVLDPELGRALVPEVARLPQILEHASAEDLALLVAALCRLQGAQDAGELMDGAVARLHSMLASAGASCQVRRQQRCSWLRPANQPGVRSCVGEA